MCKAAIDHTYTNGHGCVRIKLYLQKQAEGRICPEGCAVLIPGVHRPEITDKETMSNLCFSVFHGKLECISLEGP